MISNLLHPSPPANSPFRVVHSKKPRERHPHLLRRVVATRDISAGELILHEKPLFSTTNLKIPEQPHIDEEASIHSWFGKWIFEDLEFLEGTNSPGFFSHIYTHILDERPELLTTDTEWMKHFHQSTKPLPQDSAVSDFARRKLSQKSQSKAFLHYMPWSIRFWKLYSANAFHTSTAIGGTVFGMALYHWASYFNHSCKANAVHFNVRGQAIVVRAAADIKKDEEIFISYPQLPENIFCNDLAVSDDLPFDCNCSSCRRGEKAGNKFFVFGPNAVMLSKIHEKLATGIDNISLHTQSIIALDCLIEKTEDLVPHLGSNPRLAINFSRQAMLLLERGAVMNSANRLLTTHRASKISSLLSKVTECNEASPQHETVILLYASVMRVYELAHEWRAIKIFLLDRKMTGVLKISEQDYDEQELAQTRRIEMLASAIESVTDSINLVYCLNKDLQMAKDILLQSLVFLNVDPLILRHLYAPSAPPAPAPAPVPKSEPVPDPPPAPETPQ